MIDTVTTPATHPEAAFSEAWEAPALDPGRNAADMLKTHWSTTDGAVILPVDPIGIAKKLGIKVFTAELRRDVAGFLSLGGGQEPQFYLSDADDYNRQRFTCAHELGHWDDRSRAGVEYPERIVDYRGASASAGTDPSEIYANQFAAALLMPEDEMRRLNAKGYGAYAIADKLRVSSEAAMFRMKKLKLA